MVEVFAFQCFPAKRPDWGRIVNAETASKARYDYWLDVSESWPEIKYTEIRSRKVGPAHTSEAFARNAAYRGMPAVRCGDPVKVGDDRGVIVGHNSSANFDVLFDTGRFAGQRLNCHPATVTVLEKGNG